MNLTTWIYTKIFGEYVGQDEHGNQYYQSSKQVRNLGRKRRWVIYHKNADPSSVASSWFKWLHYQTDDIPTDEENTFAWEKPHIQNLSGKTGAYFPPGHPAGGNNRAPATGDYQPWDPNK